MFFNLCFINLTKHQMMKERNFSGLNKCIKSNYSTTPPPIINATRASNNLSSLAPNPVSTTMLSTAVSNGINATSNVTATPCLTSSGIADVNSPSKEFWERYVLEITKSIDDFGEMRVELVLCLIIAWVLVYLCLFKGIKSSGKVN